MAYEIAPMLPNEIKTGTFSYNGQVYRIDRDGVVYVWLPDAQLGGLFSSIGKIFKKVGKFVGKVAKKVAPIAIPLAAGYGIVSAATTGTLFSSPMAVAKGISNAFTVGNAIVGGGGGGGGVQMPVSVPGGPNTPIVASSNAVTGIYSILPAATAAVNAYYQSKTPPPQPSTGYYPQGQGMPTYASQQSGFTYPTTEQTPQGVPDVTDTLTKYRTPILIGMGVIGVAILLSRKGR